VSRVRPHAQGYPGPVSVPATGGGVTVDEWLAAEAGLLEYVEVLGGQFVIKRVGGNPHAQVARRLANAFEEQWGVVAAAPGRWAVETTPDGRLLVGREPDVLVDGDSLDTDTVFFGVPDVAVEVWSPTNTLAEMNAKRREYHAAGLPVFVEAYITDSGDVHLEWFVRDDAHAGRWTTVGAAAGDSALTVTVPRAFRVVRNQLLRSWRSPG
jgi:Uma2 family endonuclease